MESLRLLDSLKLFHNSLVEKIYNKSPVSCFASRLVDYLAVLVHASLIIHHIFGKLEEYPARCSGDYFKKYYVNEMGIRRMEYPIIEIQLITIVETLNLICVKLLTKY